MPRLDLRKVACSIFVLAVGLGAQAHSAENKKNSPKAQPEKTATETLPSNETPAAPKPESTPEQVTSTGDSRKSKVWDLNYFPAEGVFFASAAYRSASNTEKVTFPGTFGSTELGFYDAKITAGEVAADLGYGVNDNLQVALNITDLLEQKMDVTYGNGTTRSGQTDTIKSSGLRDPSIGLGWRSEGESGRGKVFDLFLAFSPSIGQSVTGSATESGNALRGGSRFDFAAYYGFMKDGFSWTLAFSRAQFGERESKSTAASTTVTKATGGHETFLKWNAQLNISGPVYAYWSVGAGLIGNTSADTSGTITTTDTTPIVFPLSVGLKANLSEDKWVAGLQYRTQAYTTNGNLGTTKISVVEKASDISASLTGSF